MLEIRKILPYAIIALPTVLIGTVLHQFALRAIQPHSHFGVFIIAISSALIGIASVLICGLTITNLLIQQRKAQRPSLLNASMRRVHDLLSMPKITNYANFKHALFRDLRHLESTCTEEDERRRQVLSFCALVQTSYPAFDNMTKLATAEMSSEFAWLPVPSPVLSLIARSTDLAFLAQLRLHDKMHTEIAGLKYDQLCEKTSLCPKLRHYVREKNRDMTKKQPILQNAPRIMNMYMSQF